MIDKCFHCDGPLTQAKDFQDVYLDCLNCIAADKLSACYKDDDEISLYFEEIDIYVDINYTRQTTTIFRTKKEDEIKIDYCIELTNRDEVLKQLSFILTFQ